MVAALETAQSSVSEPKKRRSQTEKVGRFRYAIELEQQSLEEFKAFRITQRCMITGLDIGGYHHFDKPYIEKVCCSDDDVDKAILNEFHCAGASGILPKDLAKALEEYDLDRWQVLRRIQRMNKRLEEEIAQKVAEK